MSKSIENDQTINLNYLSNSSLPDGTAAAPSISFAEDSNTGLFRAGNDQLGLVVGGNNTLNVSNSSALITATANNKALLTLQSISGSNQTHQEINFLTHFRSRGSGLTFTDTTDANRKFFFGRSYEAGANIDRFSFIAQNEASPTVAFDQVRSPGGTTNKNLIWNLDNQGRMGLGEGNRFPQAFIDIGADASTVTKLGNPIEGVGNMIQIDSLNMVGSSIGSRTGAYSVNIGRLTFSDNAAAATITTAATLRIAGEPIAGTNMTITNPWSLFIDRGNSYFGGTNLNVGRLTIPASPAAYDRFFNISSSTSALASSVLLTNSNDSSFVRCVSGTTAFGPSLNFYNSNSHGLRILAVNDLSNNGAAAIATFTTSSITAGTGVKIIAPSLQITTSPTAGYVLTSDASGNATWAAIPAPTTPAPSFYQMVSSVAQSISNDSTTALTFASGVEFGFGAFSSTTAASGKVALASNGIYHIIAEISFAANVSGYRAIYLKAYDGGGGEALLSEQAVTPVAVGTVIQVSWIGYGQNGFSIGIECLQNSGGSLNVNSSSLKIFRLQEYTAPP